MAIAKAGTDTSGTGTGSPLQFSHTLVAGSDRKVVIYVGIEQGDAAIDVSGVTYGGQTCTKAIDHITGTSGFRYLCEIWYIDEADLPSTGSQQVSITLSGTPTSLEINGFCAEYTGIASGVPEETDGANTSASPVTNNGGLSFSTDAWVMSTAGSGNAGTDPTHNEGQVELIDFEDASSRFTCAELRGADGENSLSTSFSGTINRLCRVCASWTEAVAVVSIPRHGIVNFQNPGIV